MANDTIVDGQIRPQVPFGEFNRIAFVFQQFMNDIQTCTLVKVIACSNAGSLSPVGTVTVRNMVHQQAGDGTAVEHVDTYNVPYNRIQGGKNAFIADPEPGDIGVCVFASRDISIVKSTKAPAVPGSFRSFAYGDALYIGGFLNAVPEQYIQMLPNNGGIVIHSPQKVSIKSPEIELDGAVTITSTLEVATDVTSNEVSLVHHKHLAGTTPTSEPIPTP